MELYLLYLPFRHFNNFSCRYIGTVYGSIVTVTGSNKGIGYAIVRDLCGKFKGDVIATARDVGRGEAATARLNKEGCHSKFHQLDITDSKSISALAKYLKETYGGVDILVNNAAIFYQSG
ncbi:Hypothetical predicted protein [Octopus vulgaris]|uniref:Carbonyl reductase [NADPH] 1-like n=1 Tax=Octopus vulgaris TaxID=6645 RepID=A0AA36B2Z7_OCTVU|nr:Hypothetical predicted protein [Octopus vulgaris]